MINNLTILTCITILTLGINCNESKLRLLQTTNSTNPYDQFYMPKVDICTPQNCQPPNGCIDVNTCKCAPGFVNYFPPGKNTTATTYCTYEQKKQLTAFLLQFFIFCAGQFYVGNIAFAIPQLFITLGPCILSCIMLCAGIGFKGGKDCCHLFVVILNCLFACALCGWWLADVILFGMNKYTDSNGVPLQGW
jgi:hypothetical protein